MRQAELDAVIEQARAAWPGVEVPRGELAKWLQSRDPKHAVDLYLACACVRGDSKAHAVFEQRFFSQLTGLARFGSDSFVDEVKQELRQHLFFGRGKPKLAEYAGKSGLLQWVRAVGTRVALNVKRTRKDERFSSIDSDEGLFELPSGDGGPELGHMKELYRGEFKKAFAEGLASLEAEPRTFLRQYYIDGLGVVQLAKLHGTSAPTVTRRLQAARAKLLELTREKLAARLAVNTTELESIMRLIESRLSADALTSGS